MAIVWLPKPSPLFIDKLSMTLDIPEHQKQIVIKNFEEILNGMVGGKMHQTKHYYINKKLYLDGEIVLFQCFPRIQNCSFFRMEWNPAKIETTEIAEVTNLILPDGYSALIKYGRITRIDIATDVKHLKMKNLLFRFPGMSICRNYLNSGLIETAYLGSTGSVNQFRFYDKVKEIKVSNATKPKQHWAPIPQYPTTRIEFEYRPKEISTFSKIGQNCKPIYKKLWCAMITDQELPPTTDLAGFINTVLKISIYEGFQQALYSIPKFRRTEVKDYINKNVHTSWWNPEASWESFHDSTMLIANPMHTKISDRPCICN